MIRIGENDYNIPTPNEMSFHNKAYVILNDIRRGLAPDIHGWNFII
jgi:hypothetical protein